MPGTAFRLAVACTITIAVQPVQAQTGGQPVTGTIIDPTGAVLPAAQVELKTATGTVVSVTADDAVRSGSTVSTGKLVGHSVQFTLRGQVSRFVNTAVQYTLSETRNNTAGITWMPPNSYDLSLECARADFDQRHRFDLLGTVNPGSWFNVGVALALYSGRPHSLTTGRDDFNTGVANARPPAVPRNSLEGPGYADLDLCWSHDLFFNQTKKASGPALTLGVDAFNVFNRVNATGYIGTLTSPFFARAIAAQPPRRLQFSARVKF